MSKSTLSVLSILGIILLAFVMVQHFNQPTVSTLDQNHGMQETPKQDDDIYVDIDGAIHNPGVYKFKPGTRLYRLIEQTGGFKADADQTRINLARTLKDGEHIIIPYLYDDCGDDYNHDTRIDINHASKDELTTLPNIGPATADAIIAYRENDVFENPEDIMKVSGIGEATFREIEALIKV